MVSEVARHPSAHVTCHGIGERARDLSTARIPGVRAPGTGPHTARFKRAGPVNASPLRCWYRSTRLAIGSSGRTYAKRSDWNHLTAAATAPVFVTATVPVFVIATAAGRSALKPATASRSAQIGGTDPRWRRVQPTPLRCVPVPASPEDRTRMPGRRRGSRSGDTGQLHPRCGACSCGGRSHIIRSR